MFLALSHYVHFADAGVQSDSLPSASPTTMAPPTTANIGIIPTSLSTDPSAKPSTKVFPASEALLMFFFLKCGVYHWEHFRESPPSGSAPITTIIVTLGGPPPKILALASSLLQLWPTFSAVINGQTPPTIATPLLMVAHSASTSSLVPAPAQALLDDHLLEEFFQHSVMNFLCLLRQCVSMFLEGHHSIELKHPMLLNYLDNIENIGGSRRTAPYQPSWLPKVKKSKYWTLSNGPVCCYNQY